MFVYAQDDFGNVGKISFVFTADRTAPTVLGTLKQVVAKNSYLQLNFSATDANTGVTLTYSCPVPGLSGSGLDSVQSPVVFLDGSLPAYGEGKLVTGTIQATDVVGNSIAQPIKIKIDSSGATSPGSL